MLPVHLKYLVPPLDPISRGQCSQWSAGYRILNLWELCGVTRDIPRACLGLQGMKWGVNPWGTTLFLILWLSLSDLSLFSRDLNSFSKLVLPPLQVPDTDLWLFAETGITMRKTMLCI